MHAFDAVYTLHNGTDIMSCGDQAMRFFSAVLLLFYVWWCVSSMLLLEDDECDGGNSYTVVQYYCNDSGRLYSTSIMTAPGGDLAQCHGTDRWWQQQQRYHCNQGWWTNNTLGCTVYVVRNTRSRNFCWSRDSLILLRKVTRDSVHHSSLLPERRATERNTWASQARSSTLPQSPAIGLFERLFTKSTTSPKIKHGKDPDCCIESSTMFDQWWTWLFNGSSKRSIRKSKTKR